jgi:hypothetical protein
MKVTAPVPRAKQSLTIVKDESRSDLQQSSGEVFQLLKANTTLTAWLIFLALGGGLLALYYSRIGYFPDIDWRATIVYLFAASIVGSVIGLLLALSLFAPGFIWSEFIVFESSLDNHFSYGAPEKEPCVRSIITYLGLPFLVVLLLSHVALLAGRVFYWIIAAILLAITFWVMRTLFEYVLSTPSISGRETSNTKQGVWRYLLSNFKATFTKRKPNREESGEVSEDENLVGRQIFKYSFWFTLSVLLSQISMFLIYRLSGTPRQLYVFSVLTVMCTTGVLISNHVVAVRYRYSQRQAIVASLVAAALLLFTADRFSPLSVRLMSYYGFGSNSKVDLLLNDEGVRIIDGLGLQQCAAKRLCDVEILSKVGDEYFLSVNRKTFTLPKSAVTSRQSDDRRNRSE